jgi:MoaA/NifB/PqqE/SkfB family radical SAM enzyme
VRVWPGRQTFLFYLLYGWQFFVLRRSGPLIYGIAPTDRCNLACRGCRVANTGRPPMSWEQVTQAMRGAWERGFRELYFSGGEPMLWGDGEHTLEDAVTEARRIGFFHVHIYTNGLLGLNTSADMVWVSMDGLPGTFELRRGDHFHAVDQAIRRPGHPRVAVIYVIDRNTADGVESFLNWVRDTELPVVGVMFYFHTPYYGHDELYLGADERASVIDRLLGCIGAGLPVLNSRAGLQALRSGRWPRRPTIASVVDVEGESVCCRASDDVCPDCGYAAATELVEFQRLRPSAVRNMLKYW